MAEPKVLLSDVVLGESARWHDGRLWFSDWGTGQIIRLDDRVKAVVATVDAMPFCFDWLPDGRLVSTNGGNQRLLRLEPDSSLAGHADLTGIAGPYPWNDIATDRRGHTFVNNIAFDFPGGEPKPGLVAVVTPDGAARQVADGLMFPNGMAVTADGTTLIVAESYASRLTAFTIGPDGDLTDRRVWAPLEGAAPDGITIDAEGAVWYADVPNQQCVRVREGGEAVQRVALDRGGFDCALSSDATLYIVAADFSDPAAMTSGVPTGRLLAVDVDVPGIA
jgi:sugar lactone lactonase YvrE